MPDKLGKRSLQSFGSVVLYSSPLVSPVSLGSAANGASRLGWIRQNCSMKTRSKKIPASVWPALYATSADEKWFRLETGNASGTVTSPIGSRPHNLSLHPWRLTRNRTGSVLQL